MRKYWKPGVALPLLALTGLGGCCLGECLGGGESAVVYFQFSPDTLGSTGFRQAELRTAYVVRYRDARLRQPGDTQYYAPKTRAGWQLGLAGPRHFALTFVGDSLTGPVGAYRVAVPASGRHFDLRDLYVPTRHYRCCNQARGVQFTLDGQLVRYDVPEPPLADALVLSR